MIHSNYIHGIKSFNDEERSVNDTDNVNSVKNEVEVQTFIPTLKQICITAILKNRFPHTVGM